MEPLPVSRSVADLVELANGGVGSVVERVVGHQLADGAFAAAHLVDQLLELVRRSESALL